MKVLYKSKTEANKAPQCHLSYSYPWLSYIADISNRCTMRERERDEKFGELTGKKERKSEKQQKKEEIDYRREKKLKKKNAMSICRQPHQI